MPQIPNDTRWNSQKECIDTFLKNFYKYVELANEDKLDEDITQILSNTGLFREVQHFQKQITTISTVLDKVRNY